MKRKKKYERCQNSFWDGNTVYCLLSTEIKIKKFSIWVSNLVKCNRKFYLYLFIASDSWYYLTPYLFTINISLNSYISSTGQHKISTLREVKKSDFSGGPVDKNLPANVADMGLRPSPGRSQMPWSN